MRRTTNPDQPVQRRPAVLSPAEQATVEQETARFSRHHALPTDIRALTAGSPAGRHWQTAYDECLAFLALAQQAALNLRPLARLQRWQAEDSPLTRVLFARLVESGYVDFPAHSLFATAQRRVAQMTQAIAAARQQHSAVVAALMLELEQGEQLARSGAEADKPLARLI